MTNWVEIWINIDQAIIELSTNKLSMTNWVKINKVIVNLNNMIEFFNKNTILTNAITPWELLEQKNWYAYNLLLIPHRKMYLVMLAKDWYVIPN